MKIKTDKKIYNLIVDHLKFHNKYEEMDHYLVEQLQDAYDVYYYAREKVRKDGPLQVAKSGWEQKGGIYTVQQDALKTIMDLQHKLGVYKTFADKLLYIQKKSVKTNNPVDEI